MRANSANAPAQPRRKTLATFTPKRSLSRLSDIITIAGAGLGGPGDIDPRALGQHVLAEAAARKGGAEQLAEYLAVAPARLELWLNGTEVPPVEVILRAVDLLIDDRRAPTS